MQEKLNQIKEKGNKSLESLGIIIDSINFEKEGKYNYLKIELDKVNGLDIDQVVEATNILNPIIDEINISEESYILDISSKEKGEENE